MLPERLRDDVQAQHDIGWLMLAALISRTIQAISADADARFSCPRST